MIDGTRIGIDAVVRLVLPKALRAELGITGATELEVVGRDGLIELAFVDVPAHVGERDGRPVIIAERDGPRLTAEDVRAAIDRVRR